MKICNHPNCSLPVEPHKLDRFCKEHDRLFYLLNKLTAVLYKEPSITKDKFIYACEGKYSRQEAYDVAAKLIGVKVGKADNKEKLCKAIVENLDSAPIPIEKEEVYLEEEKVPLHEEEKIPLTPRRETKPKEEKKREDKKKTREEEKKEKEEEKKEMKEVEKQIEYALHSKYNLSELMKAWDVEKTGSTLALFSKYRQSYQDILALNEELNLAKQYVLYADAEDRGEAQRQARKLQQQYSTKLSEFNGYKNILKSNLLRYFQTRDSKCIERSKKALREHQKLVINTMMEPTSRGMLVVHGVGTGKTLTAVTASQCFLDAHSDGIVNIVTPTSLQINMKKEMMAFGLDATITRDASGNIKKIEMADKRIRFYTYKGFMNDASKQCKNSLLIVDEAHNMRTPESKQANAVRDCAILATKVLLLTATPVVNGPRDLLMLMSMINPDLIPIANDADAKMPMNPEYFGCRVSMYEAPKEVEKESDYPEQRDFDYFFPMSAKAYQEYLKFEKTKTGVELMDEFEEIMHASRGGYIKMFKDTDHLETFMNGLRRASNVLEGEHGPKYQFIEQKLRDLLLKGTTKKYVIFSNYLDAGIEAVKSMLARLELPYVTVDGSMSIEKRANAVEKFNADYLGKPQEHRVMIITRAGGEGLDLKGVSDIFILEPSWNESASTQIIGRGVRYQSHMHLPKSERYVNVHRLYLVKPTELAITNQLKRKHNHLWYKGEYTYSLPELRNDLSKEEDTRPSADLYISVLSSSKQERILAMLDVLKSQTIEELFCM